MRRPYKRIARLEFREREPIWQCAEWEHRLLLPHVTRLQLPAGRMLMRQGSRQGQFVFLVRGSAVVLRDGMLLEELGTGSHIGGLTAMYGLPHPTDVVSITPVDVDVLAAQGFRSVIPLLGMLKTRIRDEIDRQSRDWCAPAKGADVAVGTSS